MRAKGCEGASTIHSLIYRARESGEEIPSFDLWDEAPASKAKLIVIDECSMVDAELGRDLKSFGVPLLVLGDPAQLPPISGGGFFTDAEPDIMLTEVHRQARDNPIIRLSMDVREGAQLDPGDYDGGNGGTRVVTRDDLDPARVDRGRSGSGRAQQYAPRLQYAHARTARLFARRCRWRATSSCACATTGARACSTADCGRSSNARRCAARFSSCICTPDENVAQQGHQGVGAAGMFHRQDRHARLGDSARNTTSLITAMCSPCTRRKGSQWDDVVLFDESFAFPDSRARWLYTGITRAAQKLTVVM